MHGQWAARHSTRALALKSMAAQGSEAVAEIWWITKVLVPLGGILIASVIIPLLLHHLKYVRERKERLFEARRNAYHEYFKKIESAVSDVGQEYEVFSTGGHAKSPLETSEKQ